MNRRVVLLALALLSCGFVRGAHASDLAVTMIVAPRDTVFAGDSIIPIFRVKNVGSADVSNFQVSAGIFSLPRMDQSCSDGRPFYLTLAAGDSMDITLSACEFRNRGTYEIQAAVKCTSDSFPQNDTLSATIYLKGKRSGAYDLAVGSIALPRDTMPMSCPFTPAIWVRNSSDSASDGFRLTCDIFDPWRNLVYSDVYGGGATVAPHDSVLGRFPQFTSAITGLFEAEFFLDDPNDTNAANDTVVKFFYVTPRFMLNDEDVRRFTLMNCAADTVSTMGMISFSAAQRDPVTFEWASGFINVLARTDTAPPVWIVRNYVLSRKSTPYGDLGGMFVDFRRMGLRPNTKHFPVILNAFLTDTPMVAAPQWNEVCPFMFDPAPAPFAVGADTLEDPAARNPASTFVDALPTFGPYAGLSDTVHRDSLVVNVDLDSSRRYFSSARYQQDWSADAPAAVANGIAWLAAALPPLRPHYVSDRDRMEEISIFRPRAMNGPFAFRDIVKSELAYIDSERIPVRVRFCSLWNDVSDIASPDARFTHSAKYDGAMGLQMDARRAPQWDWLVRAMQDSEAVVMYLGWWDSTGTRKGGHVVTVTGTASFSGTHQVRFVDDGRQDTTGGTEAPSAYWSFGPDGYARLLDCSWPNRTCFVEGLIASRFDTTITFIPSGVREPLQAQSATIAIAPNPARIGELIGVDYFIETTGVYRVTVADITGRELAVLHNGLLTAGAHHYDWRADNAPQGVHFISVTGEGKRSVGCLVRY